MSKSIDLIADLGEGYGVWGMTDDDALTQIVTSANVACGFHAGDPITMRKTVGLCVDRGVAIGAHPSFPDLRGFGRRPIELPAAEVECDVLYQLGALEAFLRPYGQRLHHVIPHGSLGNLAVVRSDYAHAIARAVKTFDPELTVVYQEGCLIQAAREEGLPVAYVGFADRAYNDDGTLVSRSLPGAVITDPYEIATRAVQLALTGTIIAKSGATLRLQCDSILFHGDGPDAVSSAARVRRALLDAGAEVAAWSPQTGPATSSLDKEHR